MADVDVLIVGAGSTGLILACDLVRRDITCRVVEQSADPARGSRGFTLKPRSLEAFDDLGIAERILAAGDVQIRTRFHLGPEPLFDLHVPPDPAGPSRPYPNSVALPQWRTESILRDRLGELGATVEFGRRLGSFTADQDGVTAAVVEGDGRPKPSAPGTWSAPTVAAAGYATCSAWPFPAPRPRTPAPSSATCGWTAWTATAACTCG